MIPTPIIVTNHKPNLLHLKEPKVFNIFYLRKNRRSKGQKKLTAGMGQIYNQPKIFNRKYR